jgi:poly(3-hydroxybutyrate) depolymerase
MDAAGKVSGLLVEKYGELSCAVRPSLSASRRAPVLCFLHGYDEGAPAPLVEAVTRWGPLSANASPRAHEFVIVAPQLAQRGDHWARHAEEVWEMAFDAARRFDGDRRALCLTGFSFGGNGVFDLAAARPEAWAALWAVDPTRRPASKPEAPLRIDRNQGEGHTGCAVKAYGDASIYDWLLSAARSRSDRSGSAGPG